MIKFLLIVYMGTIATQPVPGQPAVHRLKDPKIVAQFDTMEECQASRSLMDLKPGQFSVCAANRADEGEDEQY